MTDTKRTETTLFEVCSVGEVAEDAAMLAPP